MKACHYDERVCVRVFGHVTTALHDSISVSTSKDICAAGRCRYAPLRASFYIVASAHGPPCDFTGFTGAVLGTTSCVGVGVDKWENVPSTVKRFQRALSTSFSGRTALLLGTSKRAVGGTGKAPT